MYDESNEAVVFIHGLFMNGWEMSWLRKKFRSVDYEIEQFQYSPTHNDTQTIISSLNHLIQKLHSRKFHFVCHSLGGLIARQYLAHYGSEDCLSIVTIGTPHQGSEVAEAIDHYAWGGWLLGESSAHGLIHPLPKWQGEVPLCSIGGSHGIGLGRLFHPMLRENDGTVTVDETRLENITTHCVFHGSHMGLLFSREVAVCCVEFVKEHSIKQLNA